MTIAPDFSDPNLSTVEIIEIMTPELAKSVENVVESNVEKFYTGPEVQGVLGRGQNNLTHRGSGFEIHTEHPDNVRMALFSDQGEINTDHLSVSTEITDVGFGSESLYFNPLIKFFPPTAAMPYDIVQPAPIKELLLLKPLLELL